MVHWWGFNQVHFGPYSRWFHDARQTLDHIIKEAISTISSLCGVGHVSIKKLVKNKEFETLTGITGDQRALLIDTIIDLVVRYVAYGVSQKIYLWNKEGSTSVIVVYVAHQMVKERKDFNLCELLLTQLTDNITMTKDDGYPFHFGSLIMCLMLYFLRSLPLKENVAWKSNVPIGKKIYRYLSCLADKDKACKDHFINLQKMWCSGPVLGVVSTLE